MILNRKNSPTGGAAQERLDGGEDSLRSFRPGVDGPWDRAAAAHLLRRAAFGAPPTLVARLLELGPSTAVDHLARERDEASGTRRLLDVARSIGDLESIQSWWAHQLLRGENPIREKVALFWHGHFATSERKVDRPRWMLDQILLLREHGLGDFADLVLRVARDPAMVVWLDGNSNRRGKPNENFARELMELFTLGIGHYSEVDVREAARAFTGWHTRESGFWFNERAHDAGEKTLFGEGGLRDGEEVIERCVRRRECARFMAGKLSRFYVHPNPSERLLDALAASFESAGRRIGDFLKMMLTSRVFYSAMARRSIVASPADHVVGTLKTLEATASPRAIARHMADMGQELLRPPGVKGWDGGRSWVGSTGLLARLRFAIEVTDAGSSLRPRVPWGELQGGVGEDAVGGLLERLFPGEAVEEIRRDLEAVAGDRDPGRILAATLQLPEYNMI